MSDFLGESGVGPQVCTPGGYPYHVTYPMMHLMLPTPHGHIDTCENITLHNFICRR